MSHNVCSESLSTNVLSLDLKTAGGVGIPRSSSVMNGSSWSGKSSQQSSALASKAKVAQALLAEREAIMKELKRRHGVLLAELEQDCSSSPSRAEHLRIDSRQATSDSITVAPRLQSKRSTTEGWSRAAMDLDKIIDKLEQEEKPSKYKSNLRSSAEEDERVRQLAEAKGLSFLLTYMRVLIASSGFEILLAVLVVLNALTMAVEAQYFSFDIAHELGWPMNSLSSRDAWPGAGTALFIMEVLFCIAFSLEVTLKFIVGPLGCAKSAWNWFDFLIVLFALLSMFESTANLNINPMVLRLLRLVRLLRLLRLVKTIRVFDVLHLLIGSLRASAAVLFWSLGILVAIMLGGALVLNFLMEPYILDESMDFDTRVRVFQRYGSFTRAFVTMFEITLGGWVTPVRLVQEDISEWYAMALLVYVSLVTFATVQVIKAVFTHETFKVAELDDDMMIMQKERQMKKFCQNMERLFYEADESGDGYISFEEFIEITSDPRVKTWLAAMDFDVSDAKLIYDLIDDGSHKLSAQELMKGVGKLKGTARSIDIISVQAACHRIEKLLGTMDGGRSWPASPTSPVARSGSRFGRHTFK